MQVIVSSIRSIHQLFNEIEKLYALTSEPPTKAWNFTVFEESFRDVINLFAEYGKTEYDVFLKHKLYGKLTLPQMPTMNIIVCFSGGKDSLAAALHYRALGYKVYLYHLKGINKTYKDEYKAVEELAEVLQMPLIEEEVCLSGDHCWTEHPLKNWIIASRALQYGITNGISTKVAFGNYYTAHIWDNVFEVCAGDTVEMFQAFETVVKRIIPSFKVYIPLRNILTSFNALEKHPQLLPKVQSCIGPYRYREYLHDNNEQKYSVKLLPHRCGSCWKCCAEYIWAADHNFVEYSKEFYQHCIQILRKTIKQESGIDYRNEQTVWSHYMFYPIKKSKYFKKVVYK